MTIEVEGALRSSVRDELESVGFVATASKLYRPSPGTVPRSALVKHVEAQRSDVVVVTAPAGYGKSTFLAELAANDGRPVAWVSLTPGENEPAEFLAYVALALDAIEPVDPGFVTTLWGASPTIGSPALQRFGAMLAGRRQPFILVLDDVHELVSREVVDILPMLLAEMPAGSRIMLGARTAIQLPLGRLRVRRRLVEIGAAELAFDESEAATLFRQLDVDADRQEVARLVERTEGWPVALYLAALAHGSRRGAMVNVVDDFTGDHRYLVDYLGEELLSQRGLRRRLVPDGGIVLRAGLGEALRRRAGAPRLGAALGGPATAEPPRDPARRTPGVVPLSSPPRRLPAGRAAAPRSGPSSRHPSPRQRVVRRARRRRRRGDSRRTRRRPGSG